MTREEAIICLKGIKNYGRDTFNEQSDWQGCLDMAIQALLQEPKTGHWIYDKNIDNWRCSECGETPKTMGYCGSANFMEEHFKYCNHCGIKMQEAESEGT